MIRTSGELHQLLAEFDALRDPGADPQLEALRVAVLVEELTGVVLPEEAIDPAALRDCGAVMATLARLGA